MKKFSLLVLSLICIGITLNAQTSNEHKTVIAATNMNVVYVGVNNPISVAVAGIDNGKLLVRVTQGNAKIQQVGDGNYILNVKKEDSYETAAIGRTDKDGNDYTKDTTFLIKASSIVEIAASAIIDNKVIDYGTQKFRVKEIPKPLAMLGSIDGGKIAKEMIIAQGGIKVIVQGFDFPVKYEVKGFKMCFSSYLKNAPLISKDNKFTPEMISRLKTLKKGDKVYIEGISVEGPDNEKSVLNSPMIFTIR
jgi:hypothetical protein